MRRLLSLPALLVLAGCASSPAPAPAAAEAGERRLQILHTNDFHGRLLPRVSNGDTLGGGAVLAAHFDSARVRFDGPTLLLSAGDVMQGTAISNLTWGRAAIDLYTRLGYTAAAFGNHEFDWGIDTLQARVGESGFPWLGANIFLEGSDEHPEWVVPSLLLEVDGIRVGIVGVGLSTTPEVVMAGMVDGLAFRDEGEALDREIPRLREQGAEVVVAVGHVGAVCRNPGSGPHEPSTGCEGRVVEILEGLRHPPDLFFAGHTHLRNLAEVRGIPLTQNPAYSETFSVTEVAVEDGVRVLRRELRTPLAREVDPDTTVARIVAEWAADVEPLLAREVALLAEAMSNEDRLPVENAAGNLLADAHRWGSGAEVALVNNGALRRSLPEGSVTWGVLYEFQPFQNDLVVVTLSDATLRSILEHALTDDGRPRAHVSGIRVEYHPSRPRGERVARILRDDGSEVVAGDRVAVGTTEFVAAGGDGFTMFLEGEVRGTGVVDLDALVRYLERFEGAVPSPELGRWTPIPSR